MTRAVEASPRRRTRLAAACFVVGALGNHAQGIPGDDDTASDVIRAEVARRASDFSTAIRILEAVTAREPRPAWLGLLAETYAWSGRLEDAARVYRVALEREPESRDLLVGSARVALWQGRAADARATAERLLARRPDDADAAEIAGLAAYWVGDFRTAARRLRVARRLRPDRLEVREALAGIEAAAAPRVSAAVESGWDDQPFRSTQARIVGSYFSDPMTRWDTVVGATRLEASGAADRRLNAPFVRTGVETAIPSLASTAAAWLEALRTSAGRTLGLGGVSVKRGLGNSGDVSFRADRRAVAGTRAAIADRSHVTTFALGWELPASSSWVARAEFAILRYSDANEGFRASAFVLAPVPLGNVVSVHVGPAVSYQDTAESRFRLAGVVGRPLGGGEYAYVYFGSYDPYWTPARSREVRLAASLDAAIAPRLVVRLSGDGGWGRDRAVGYGPATGSSPRPASPFAAEFERSYRPWRFEASMTLSLDAGLRVDAAFERRATVFYRSCAVRASLVRRF